MELTRVKRELRELKRLGHAIDAGVRAEERLQRIMNSECGLRSINESYTKRASRLAVKYVDAISKLTDPTDRIIATEAFLNGKTYIAIGKIIYMSEIGVKKRVERIYRKITVQLNNK